MTRDSIPIGRWPSRLRRILRRAWKTWARALSSEQERLAPISEYSSSCIFLMMKASRCFAGSPVITRSNRSRASSASTWPSARSGASGLISSAAAA